MKNCNLSTATASLPSLIQQYRVMQARSLHDYEEEAEEGEGEDMEEKKPVTTSFFGRVLRRGGKAKDPSGGSATIELSQREV